MKRFFDLFFALVLALPACAICLVLLASIRLESPGNPLFVQSRVGRNLRIFKLYKLRTMTVMTENLPSHQAGTANVTRIGRFLRRTKLDELPQLINIFRGEMSFVGPRPCLPIQKELIEERRARNVYKIRPGITGPAQLAGINMSTPHALAEADAEYMNTRNVASDLALMIRTALGRGGGDAASH